MQHTEEQQKVFEFVKSGNYHGIIDAVAGSGKTTTIIDSAEYLNAKTSALFCAFNKSIAKEIQVRFTSKRLHGITVKTIHALGFDILKSNSSNNYKLTFNKYDQIIENNIKSHLFDDEILQLLDINNIKATPSNKYEEGHLRKFRFTLKHTLLDLSAKFRLTLTKNEPKELKNLIVHYNILNEKKVKTTRFDEEVGVYYSLNKKIIENGNQIAEKVFEIDYTDMLFLPFVWKLSPNNKFDFLFIDECQDLSRSQLAVALKYVKPEGRVLAVGDPYQSIYGFTGADIESFDTIIKTLNASPLSLSKCFRCPDQIITLAQAFRSDITSFAHKEGRYEWIELSKVIGLANPGNLILCRRKAPIQELMFDMLERNMAVEVHEDEVKEFINDIKYVFLSDELIKKNPFREVNFFDDVKARNLESIEKKSKRFIDQTVKGEFSEEEEQLLDSKLNFIKNQLLIQKDSISIDELLKKLEKLIAGGENAVKLSTIHRAKGLENDVVFILEYDRLPLTRDGQKSWEQKQERNLQYVALTRARKHLFLVKAEESPEKVDGSLFDILDDF